MDTLVMFLALAVLVACAAVMIHDRRVRKRQKRLVAYLRQSDLYAHLYPMVKRIEQMHIESVAVRREEVCVRAYEPAGRTLRFTFDKHGFDPLEDDRLYALTLALAVDAPILRDSKRYDLLKHEDQCMNGGKAAWYEYMIRTEFKDSMVRARYADSYRENMLRHSGN